MSERERSVDDLMGAGPYGEGTDEDVRKEKKR